jgi:hypothetical protein
MHGMYLKKKDVLPYLKLGYTNLILLNSYRQSNKTQQCIKILFHIYMKLNMFRTTHHPLLGA